MANYVGNYRNDLGVLFQLARVSVYAVVNEVRSATQETTDRTFFPTVLTTALSANGRVACEIVSGTRTIRHARVYFQADGYLHLPCLWPGGAPEFNQFHQELLANPQVLRVEQVGERINPWYTQVFTG